MDETDETAKEGSTRNTSTTSLIADKATNAGASASRDMPTEPVQQKCVLSSSKKQAIDCGKWSSARTDKPTDDASDLIK